MNKTDSKWIAHGRISENAKYNLICFPFAGGSASAYAPWVRFLGEDISLFPVLYPMREKRMREPMPVSLSVLAENFTAETPEAFEKPYILLGHCTGAMTAYETFKNAVRLYGRKPSLFVAVSAPSPRMKITDRSLRTFSDEDMLKYMAEKNLVDERTLALKDFVKYYIPIFKKDFILHDEYDCCDAEKLDCDVIVLTGTDDKLVDNEKITDWKNFTTGSFEHISYSGDHFFINSHLNQVIELIKSKIFTGAVNNG